MPMGQNNTKQDRRSATARYGDEGDAWVWIRCRCDVGVSVVQRLLPFAGLESKGRLRVGCCKLLHGARQLAQRSELKNLTWTDRG